MQDLRAAIRDLRNVVYILAHALLLVLGAFIALLQHPWAEPLGLSLMAAGIAGYVVFLYVLISRDVADKLEVLKGFGIAAVFPARASKIQHEYERRLARAEHHIDVLAFGLSDLREDFGERFPEWKVRARVRILLIDPEYPDKQYSLADERDREERRPAGRIKGDVLEFVKFVRPILDDRFQVRLYTCLPTINIFRIDDEVLWGPYFVREQGRNTPTFVATKGPMFAALMGHFSRIWEDSDLSRSISDDTQAGQD